MIDLALDPASRDMVFGRTASGAATLMPLDGADRVGQAIGIRLRTWLGEWFLDTTHGVPYAEEILDKNRSEAMVAAVLRAEILGVASVRRLDTFDLQIDPVSRKAFISFTAATDEGLVRGSLLV